MTFTINLCPFKKEKSSKTTSFLFSVLLIIRITIQRVQRNSFLAKKIRLTQIIFFFPFNVKTFTVHFPFFISASQTAKGVISSITTHGKTLLFASLYFTISLVLSILYINRICAVDSTTLSTVTLMCFPLTVQMVKSPSTRFTHSKRRPG